MKANHEKIKNMFPDFLAEVLPPEQRKMVFAHLELCEDCRKELSLITELHKAVVPDPGDKFWNTLRVKVRTAAEEQKPFAENTKTISHKSFSMKALPVRFIPAAVAIGVIIVFAIRHIDNKRTSSGKSIVVSENTSVRMSGYRDPLAAFIIDYSLIKQSDIPSPLQQVQIETLYPELAYSAGSYYSRFASLNAEELKKLDTILKSKEKKRS